MTYNNMRNEGRLLERLKDESDYVGHDDDNSYLQQQERQGKF